MMDEVAFITATRFTRKRCVTVLLTKLIYQAHPSWNYYQLIGNVTCIGKQLRRES
jgi:hypothetical protein